ncbi:hypothetical protein GCM10025789_20810 [Tessaracoccus lubricantis]|uniref:Uncharacterized protein n=1 Tax=Tessaracoccus lubricantis TaxID=545543 RepID=A0ABP9FFX3_9ACTN
MSKLNRRIGLTAVAVSGIMAVTAVTASAHHCYKAEWEGAAYAAMKSGPAIRATQVWVANDVVRLVGLRRRWACSSAPTVTVRSSLLSNGTTGGTMMMWRR